jgi:hypothetical protein
VANRRDSAAARCTRNPQIEGTAALTHHAHTIGARVSSIFHYTDAKGLIGILSSKSLFATHYRYLNDTSEASAIRDLLMPIFEEEIASLLPKLVQEGYFTKEYYEHHGLAGHRVQAEECYMRLVRAVDDTVPYFLVSFCRHDEKSDAFKHGLLSQWRGYADGGGFAIEFDEESLESLMQYEREQFSYASVKASDVFYGNFEKLFLPEIYK